jgi:hypothetical protein
MVGPGVGTALHDVIFEVDFLVLDGAPEPLEEDMVAPPPATVAIVAAVRGRRTKPLPA